MANEARPTRGQQRILQLCCRVNYVLAAYGTFAEPAPEFRISERETGRIIQDVTPQMVEALEKAGWIERTPTWRYRVTATGMAAANGPTRRRAVSERGRETMTKVSLSSFLVDAEMEAVHSRHDNGPMNSLHEAYAVLLEEVDELWQHVKTKPKRRDAQAIYRELVQIAAVAACTAVELFSDAPTSGEA